MMVGIISAWIFIKKRVYLCPAGATCPGSFHPNNSFLQDIRTVMQYWLHVGMLIFGVGLVKLVAYQSWSTMRQQGNTINILDLNIGALKGSAYDAANILLLRSRNRSLGMFVLIHVAIIAAISLVVGKSITTTVTDARSVELLFDYPMNISISNVNPDQQSITSLGDIKYAATWDWLTNGANLTINETFSGTFIIQDSRAKYGQPSGQQIGGSVSCIDPSAYISVNSSNDWVNVSFESTVPDEFLLEFPAIGRLISRNLNLDPASTGTFIWFTVTDGIIPNAMKASGVAYNYSEETWNVVDLFIGLCEHTITFSNLPQNDASGDGMQYIKPSQPVVYYPVVYLPPGRVNDVLPPEINVTITPATLPGICEECLKEYQENSVCDEGCMTQAVWNTLRSWWGPQDTMQMDIYCYGGALAPGAMAPAEDANQTCPSLDSGIWNNTLALVLDAIIQTYPRVGNASQKLFIQVESIGMWQWWLQGIIPLSAFILYVACLVYTVTVYWVGETVKELDLLEVVNATHAEEKRLTKLDMVGGDLKEQVGRLRK